MFSGVQGRGRGWTRFEIEKWHVDSPRGVEPTGRTGEQPWFLFCLGPAWLSHKDIGVLSRCQAPAPG